LKRFQGGLVSKAERLWYHSTLSLRDIKKKKGFGGRVLGLRGLRGPVGADMPREASAVGIQVQGLRFRVRVLRGAVEPSVAGEARAVGERAAPRGSRRVGGAAQTRGRRARSDVRRVGINLFRGGLVFKAHRLLYHSTLGSRVIKRKNNQPRRTRTRRRRCSPCRCRRHTRCTWFGVEGSGLSVEGLGIGV